MRRFFTSLIIITLFFSLIPIVRAVQLPPEEVHISASVPYGVVDFPPPVITTSPGAPEGAPIVQVINLRDTSLEITWYTIENSISIVEYGESAAYGTTVVDWNLVKYHKVKLTDLKPKTFYYFRVKSRTNVGKESISLGYTFKTLDLTSPANVSNFQALPGDRQITLTWLNPADEDFVGVKIQMSTKMYPGSPKEGVTVYDGKETETAISGLINGVRYYFTAFSYDDSGNYASGAIASAIPTKEAVPPELVPFVPPELVPKIAEITLQDFFFWVEGAKLLPVEGVITVKPGQIFKISIPAEKLPKVLKVIITIIGTPTGLKLEFIPTVFAQSEDQQVSSYLLRINPEETAYEAIITAPKIPDTYPMTTVIMDFKEGTVSKIQAKLKVEAPMGAGPLSAAGIGIKKEAGETPSWTPLLVLIALVLMAGAAIGYLIGKLRRKIWLNF